MEKQTYPCAHCGKQCRSRAARSYHVRFACTKNPNSEAFKAVIDQPEVIPEPEVKAEQMPLTSPQVVPVVSDPDPEPEEEEEDGDISKMEEPESDIPWILLLPVILLLMLATGALIFRDRIREFMRRRRPRYGVPAYV
jgi:hypothetical protein